MVKWILIIVILIEAAALANRGGGPLTSHLVLTGGVFVICCLAVAGKMRLNASIPVLLYSGFFAAFLVSLTTALTPEYGLSELLLFANTGILFIILSGAQISESLLSRLKVALVLLVTIDTLIGVFLYTQTPFPRFAGTFLDLGAPHTSFGNDYANFMLLTAPLAFSWYFSRHERRTTTLLAGLSTSLLFSGFLLSFSRAAWISFAVIALVAVVWMLIKRRKPALPPREFIFRGAAFLLTVIVLTSAIQFTRSQSFETTSLYKKLTFQADEGTASASERLAFWKGAVALIKERPLTGGGVLSFKYLHPTVQKSFGVNWDHPHNVFLKIAVENGVPAAILFAMFLIACIVPMLFFFWKNPRHPAGVFTLGALAAFGHNLLDFNFIVSNFTLFIAAMAIAFSFVSFRSIRLSAWFLIPPTLALLWLGFHEGYYNIDFKLGRADLAVGRNEQAVDRLLNAERLYFRRDLTLYIADAYRATDMKNEEKNLLMFFSQETIDAEIPERLGEILFNEGKFREAEPFVEKALALDPRNNLSYYYYRAAIYQKLGKPMPEDFRKTIVRLLSEYGTLLKENRHFTILTKNPEYAVKLYGLLGMQKEKEALTALWLDEIAKYRMKYGAEAPAPASLSAPSLSLPAL